MKGKLFFLYFFAHLLAISSAVFQTNASTAGCSRRRVQEQSATERACGRIRGEHRLRDGVDMSAKEKVREHDAESERQERRKLLKE